MLDAGGVIKHTQVGFTAGDEKTYLEEIGSILGAGCAAPGGVGEAPADAPRVPWWPPRDTPQRMLFHSASSTDSPHRVVLPLVFAINAKKKGHDPVVFLAGDATLLMKEGVLKATRAAGQPDAKSLVEEAAALGIPIFL